MLKPIFMAVCIYQRLVIADLKGISELLFVMSRTKVNMI